jgi:hypothetical protein
MLSRLFFRHKIPQPRYAQGLFFGLILVFGAIAQVKPVVGLAGLGTVAIIAAALIELNRERIWNDYRAYFKKHKGVKGMWAEPKPIYYTLNVSFLWPFVACLGVLCLWTAYTLV